MGRLWLKNHNLPYSLYLFEETLFTPLLQGQFAVANDLFCIWQGSWAQAITFGYLRSSLGVNVP